MKEHVDAVRCLRKSGKPTGLNAFLASPLPPWLWPDTTEWAAAIGRGADIASTPTHTTIEENLQAIECPAVKNTTKIALTVVLCIVYRCLPIVSLLPDVINRYPSDMMSNLI